MKQRYNYRIYPNKEQTRSLEQMTGNCRWLWNYMLGLNIKEYETSNKFIFAHDMITRLPDLKTIHAWLKLSYSQSLQSTCRDLDLALRASFKKIRGFPKFKSKRDINSVSFPQHIKVIGKKLRVPKVGDIRIKLHRELPEFKTVTIKKNKIGHWYASFVVEVTELPIIDINTITCDKVVGLDMNAHSVDLSDGTSFKSPRPNIKFKKKTRYIQRKISRAQKTSRNREKLIYWFNKIEIKKTNIRRNFTHQVSRKIANSYDLIAMETLDIRSMKQHRRTAIAVQDNQWSTLFNFIEYKVKLLGKHTSRINQYLPSTKTCSRCGDKQDISINTRIYDCKSCGSNIPRDLNSAINIRNWGYESLTGMKYQSMSGQELSVSESYCDSYEPMDVIEARLSSDISDTSIHMKWEAACSLDGR